MRRGVNMVYIVENNGVYGLTKGQFSATADKGSKSKRGAVNSDEPIDLVMLALTLGATFVARGFSGDKEQLVPLIKAAVAAQGRRVHRRRVARASRSTTIPGSTKSYDYVREHNEAVNLLDFMPAARRVTTRYAPGERRRRSCCTTAASIRLRKLDAELRSVRQGRRRWPTSKRGARPAKSSPACSTSHADSADLHDAQNTVDAPLNALSDAELVPGSAALAS